MTHRDEAGEAHAGAARALAAGDLRTAVRLLQRAAALAPGSADVRCDLGQVLAMGGDDAGAREWLDRALSLNPRHALANYNLGLLKARRGDPMGALGHLRTAAAGAGGDIDVDLALVAALRATGETAEAESILRAALGRAPGDPAVLLALVDLLLEQTRVAEAGSALATTPTTVPDGVRHAVAARIALADGRHTEAREHARASAAADPGLPQAVLAASEALLRTGDAPAAHALLARLPAQAAADPEVQLLACAAALEAGLDSAALEHARGAQVRRPDDPRVLALLARCHRILDDLDGARTALAHGLARSPSDRRLLLEQAQQLRWRGRAEDAVTLLTPLRDSAPGDVSLAHGLAGALAEAGRNVAAADLARERVQTDPDDATAWSLLRTNHRFDADDLYELTPLLDRLAGTAWPDHRRAAGHFAAARALDAAGRFDEAFQHARAANALRRPLAGYDPEAARQRSAAIMATFDAATLARLPAHPTRLPVVVAGLPRSGTTLVERTLSAHREVDAAGETGHLSNLIKRIPAQHLGEALRSMTAEQANTLVEALTRHAASPTRRRRTSWPSGRSPGLRRVRPWCTAPDIPWTRRSRTFSRTSTRTSPTPSTSTTWATTSRPPTAS